MSPLAYLAPSFRVLPTGRRPFPDQQILKALTRAVNPLTSAFSMFSLTEICFKKLHKNLVGFYRGPGQLPMLVCLHGTHCGNHCINASPATCALSSVSFWLLSISQA